MTLRTRNAPAVIALSLALITLTLLAGQWLRRQREADPAEKVTLGVAVQPVSAPVYVAFEKGLFTREGLDVTMRHFWTGKDALRSVLQGTADFCTVAETPVMFAALRKEPITVIATLADSRRYMKIAARSDRDIAGPSDLAGKQIGVSVGTNAQYYLDAFLAFFGVPRGSIRVVPLAPEKIADALAEGRIDAAVTWDPHLGRLQNLLGSNSIVLENTMIYELYWNIATRQEFAATRTDAVRRLLRALLRAQHYMEEHPQEAQGITARYVGSSRFDLSEFNFDLRLSQSLILSLEEQARWAVRTGLTGTREAPNFLRFVHTAGLASVAPDSVNLPLLRRE